MTDSAIEQHLPLHPLNFRILMALSEGPSFGTAIVKRIEESERGTRLYPANLFRRIRDLLAEELIEECAGPEGADPRRSYIRLTDSGRAVARGEARRLRDLLADADALQLLGDA